MAFFDGFARRVAQQGKNALDISKAAAELKNAEHALRKAYRELGEKYIQSLEGNIPESELASYVLRARQAALEIEIIKDRASALKDLGICRECGAKLTLEMRYCKECGAKVPDIYSGTSSRDIICPNCSRPVNPELMFCTNCNMSLSEIDGDEGSDGPLEINICPFCHKLVPNGSSSCPECGEIFE